MNQEAVIGVDLGGTNVRAAVVLPDGTFASERREIPSNGEDGAEATAFAVSEVVKTVMEESGIRPSCVGIAIPGTVDDTEGVVRWSPNLGRWVTGVFHYWKDVPFRDLLLRHLDVPTTFGNDANLAALGEYRFGAGKDKANCLVMFTIGTGIGFGVVMAPTSLQGDVRSPVMLLGGNKGGAEGGHMVILRDGADTTAGTYGTVEAYCQKDSIVRRATNRLVRGRPSILNDWTEGDFGKVTPKMLSMAADHGDELAIQVWREVGEYLGVGITNAVNIFAPDIVAVGGQIAKAGEWLLGPARNVARDSTVPSLWKDTKVVQAEQIENAGLLGGAALALSKVG